MAVKFVALHTGLHHTQYDHSYFGHFILTETLLPLLIRTAKEEGSDVRIINVSSVACCSQQSELMANLPDS